MWPPIKATSTITHNVRLALRQLRRWPIFATTVILTLAIGIGATTAAFALVESVFLTRLPIRDQERVVSLGATKDPNKILYIPWDVQQQIRDRHGPIAGVAAYWLEVDPYAARYRNRMLHLTRVMVSGRLFGVLGVRPTLGRLIEPTDDVPGAPDVVVIGNRISHDEFSSGPHVIGKTIFFAGTAFRIIGVAPPEFWFPGRTDAWIPLVPYMRRNGLPLEKVWTPLVGRLAPGVTPRAARAELHYVLQADSASGKYLPDNNIYHAPLETAGAVDNFADAVLGGEVRSGVLVLFVAVGLILVIGCTNVAGLLLARGISRAPDLAVRTALGASRRQLGVYALTESGLLGLAASVPDRAQGESQWPRFFSVQAGDGTRIEVRNPAVLQRQESLALSNVPLGTAVRTITDRAGLEVTFSNELIPPHTSVSMKADDVTVATALTRVLSHTNLDVLVGDDGHLTLVPRGGQEVAVDSSGVLTGSLADADDGEPIPYASVAILGTDRIGQTDADGRFLFPGLTAKSTTVRATQIGYASADTTVVVLAGPAVTTTTIRLHRIAEPLRAVEVHGRASAPPALPPSVRGYRLAEGPVLDPTTGGLRYQYRREQDRIEVTMTPYDAAASLRTTDDTVQIVRDDIAVMYDTLTRLADNNDARVERRVDREDDIRINGHTYRGWVALWRWESRLPHRRDCDPYPVATQGRASTSSVCYQQNRLDRQLGCDAASLTQGRAPTWWSCYQQSYATPHGLLRVRPQLSPVGAPFIELAAFSNEVLAVIVSPP